MSKDNIGICDFARNDESGEMKRLVYCNQPELLENYLNTHFGTIVPVQIQGMEYRFSTKKHYTLENIGYDVHGERAYKIVTPTSVFTWGLIDTEVKSK